MALQQPRALWSLCLLACLSARPSVAHAQEAGGGLRVDALVTAALERFIPQHYMLGGVSVADRGLLFDAQRTLASFGTLDTTVGRQRLSILDRAGVENRSRSDALSDCDQARTLTCAGLGPRAFSWLEAAELSERRAVVRLYVFWSERASVIVEEQVQTSSLGRRTGFMIVSEWQQSSSADWTFVKTLASLAF